MFGIRPEVDVWRGVERCSCINGGIVRQLIWLISPALTRPNPDHNIIHSKIKYFRRSRSDCTV